jgi:hypothetical protein
MQDTSKDTIRTPRKHQSISKHTRSNQSNTRSKPKQQFHFDINLFKPEQEQEDSLNVQLKLNNQYTILFIIVILLVMLVFTLARLSATRFTLVNTQTQTQTQTQAKTVTETVTATATDLTTPQSRESNTVTTETASTATESIDTLDKSLQRSTSDQTYQVYEATYSDDEIIWASNKVNQTEQFIEENNLLENDIDLLINNSTTVEIPLTGKELTVTGLIDEDGTLIPPYSEKYGNSRSLKDQSSPNEIEVWYKNVTDASEEIDNLSISYILSKNSLLSLQFSDTDVSTSKAIHVGDTMEYIEEVLESTNHEVGIEEVESPEKTNSSTPQSSTSTTTKLNTIYTYKDGSWSLSLETYDIEPQALDYESVKLDKINLYTFKLTGSTIESLDAIEITINQSTITEMHHIYQNLQAS